MVLFPAPATKGRNKEKLRGGGWGRAAGGFGGLDVTPVIRTRIEEPGWQGSGEWGYFLLGRGSPIIRAGTTISEDNPEVRMKAVGER